MISFLKRLFRKISGKKISGKTQQDVTIQFKDSPEVTRSAYKHPDEDVHKLMIKATSWA